MLAAVVNTVFGVLVAWMLVRYRFPGRRWLDAAVDLPFALPTAVAGIALATLYAPNGPFGAILDDWFNVKVGFQPAGVVMALIFVGLPFVVRTVQPVLEEIDRETEEVSATLGAGRWRTVTRVILPALLPAILTGFALSFARGVGEYGSVIFIASQPALQVGDRAAADRDPAGRTQLCRRDGDCSDHAGDLVRHAVRDQPAAGLEPEMVRP